MIINNPHEHGNKPYRKYLPLLAALLSTDAQLPLVNSRHIKEKGAGSISVVLDLLATAGYSAADECYIQRYPSYEIGHINRFSARHSRANHDDPSAPGLGAQLFRLNAYSDGLSGLGSEFRPCSQSAKRSSEAR